MNRKEAFSLSIIFFAYMPYVPKNRYLCRLTFRRWKKYEWWT